MDYFEEFQKPPGSPQTVHILEKDRSAHLAGSLNQLNSIQG